MTKSELEAYYWNVYALIFESDDILALDNPNFSLSDVDTAIIAQAIHAVLPLQNHSQLYAEILLVEDIEIIEDQYAYIYYDAKGQRIFQYDNRNHHPNLSTHPHHMHKGAIPTTGEKDRAWPTDIEFINFETVLQQIRDRFFA